MPAGRRTIARVLEVGRTTIVDPTLDRGLAEGIGAALADRDVQPVVDIAEAFEASDGLLMEFLSMLRTGRRLKQVVEEQVAARLSEDRTTEREILRYVATAHSAGVAIPAELLESLLPGHDLTPAFVVLNREHLVVVDSGNRWLGLHELRSGVARDYLHQFPPPAAATTVRRLVEHLSVDDASRIIEVYARLDADLVPAAEAVSSRLRSSDIQAGDATRLVASLAMADAFRHARTCLEVIGDRRPRKPRPLEGTPLCLLASLQWGQSWRAHCDSPRSRSVGRDGGCAAASATVIAGRVPAGPVCGSGARHRTARNRRRGCGLA